MCFYLTITSAASTTCLGCEEQTLYLTVHSLLLSTPFFWLLCCGFLMLFVSAYIVTCLWFAYVEGFKGFQQKFSPLVVKRSFTLSPGQNGTKWYHFIFAPMYSMALFHATRKRKIVSWSVTTGVAIIVAAVKRLPYPYRNIVDAGVVAGLTWGSISILILYLKAWITGKSPDIDAALPENVVEKTKK